MIRARFGGLHLNQKFFWANYSLVKTGTRRAKQVNNPQEFIFNLTDIVNIDAPDEYEPVFDVWAQIASSTSATPFSTSDDDDPLLTDPIC